MQKIFFIILSTFFLNLQAQEYEFCGTHYVASFIDCDHVALCDFQNLQRAMIDGIQSCGATLLHATEHIFPPDSITMVFLLSESHASIHTYPECDSCFIDLFTCGHSCDYAIFEKFLKNYLKPKQINHQIMRRK